MLGRVPISFQKSIEFLKTNAMFVIGDQKFVRNFFSELSSNSGVIKEFNFPILEKFCPEEVQSGHVQSCGKKQKVATKKGKKNLSKMEHIR